MPVGNGVESAGIDGDLHFCSENKKIDTKLSPNFLLFIKKSFSEGDSTFSLWWWWTMIRALCARRFDSIKLSKVFWHRLIKKGGSTKTRLNFLPLSLKLSNAWLTLAHMTELFSSALSSFRFSLSRRQASKADSTKTTPAAPQI